MAGKIRPFYTNPYVYRFYLKRFRKTHSLVFI